MKNFRNKAITVTAMILTFLSITTKVFADAVAPPTVLHPQGKAPSIYWMLLLILIICVVGFIALKGMNKKK